MLRRIILLLALASAVLSCHYSCETCYLGNSFVNCTKCLSGNITVMQDPDYYEPVFFNYHRYTGTCGAETNSAVNGYGIALLLLAVSVSIFTRKRESFMFLNSIQNIAFVSFLGVNFVSPVSYALQGLQYFLLFSKAQVGRKWTDEQLKTSGFYNLNSFLGTVDYVTNVMQLDVFIGVIGFALFITVLVESLCIDKVTDSIKQKFIKRIVKRCVIAVKYLFYFTIAEHFMLGAVAIRWGSTYSGASIMIGFYLALLLYFCVYCYYRSIKFFGSRVAQYWNIAQKILYGILVAFPITPLVLPLVMVCCTIVEAIYEWRMTGLERRLIVYRSTECIVLLVLVGYIVVELQGTNAVGSKGIAALAVSVISIYSIVPLVELSVHIYYRVVANRVAAEKAATGAGVLKGRMVTEQIALSVNNPADNTKEMMMVNELEFNESGLEQIKLEEANADGNRHNDIYQFEEDALPEKKIGKSQEESQDYEPATGKKLKEGEAAATAMKFNPRDNVIEMMNMTQKSPARKRAARDPAREQKLKMAYGIP